MICPAPMSRAVSVRRTETGGGEWTYETIHPQRRPVRPRATRPGQSITGNSELNGTFHCSLGTSSLTSAVQNPTPDLPIPLIGPQPPINPAPAPAPGWWCPLPSTNNRPSFSDPRILSTYAEELDGHGVDAAREVEDGALVEVGADVEDVGVG